MQEEERSVEPGDQGSRSCDICPRNEKLYNDWRTYVTKSRNACSQKQQWKCLTSLGVTDAQVPERQMVQMREVPHWKAGIELYNIRERDACVMPVEVVIDSLDRWRRKKYAHTKLFFQGDQETKLMMDKHCRSQKNILRYISGINKTPKMTTWALRPNQEYQNPICLV